MALYSYQKAPNSKPSKNRGPLLKPTPLAQITLGDALAGLYHDFHRFMSSSKWAGMVVPAVLILTGITIIYNQVWPTIYQEIQKSNGYFADNSTPLVAGSYIASRQEYSNPGARYFAELKSNANSEHLLFSDEKSSTYKGNFKLSIDSLGLKNLKVTSNVDSGVQEQYDKLLVDGLAHFAGTNLPFSDNGSSNIVIYGHSSAGDYYERTKDPAAAFSRLSQIRYGSEIVLEFNGQQYRYKFIKGKVVKADDLTVLEGQRGQKLLTLFTCYPNGNNTERFVATARLVE